MMDELLKKLEAKGKSKMGDEETRAKLEVVQELLAMAQDAMADQTKSGLDEMLAPKQSVEVMAGDEEGLAEGLDLAKDMVEGEELPEMEEASEEMPELKLDAEAEESDEDESEDDEDEVKRKTAFPSLL